MNSRVALRSLVSSYIGGGWGKEEIGDSHPEPAYVIRGTDLADAEYGAVGSVPYRFHKTSNLASRRLEPNEIVMEVSGGSIDQPVGRVMYVDEHVLGSLDGPVMCASFCKRIVPDGDAVHPSYLYWYLQAVYSSGLIERYQVQSTGIRNLQFEYLLDDLPVHLPPRDEQERAVAALDAILDALRANRRRIEILEELARRIYREWFVHFRFPGHEAIELIDSDLGPIPEGWKATTLAEAASYINRGIAPKYDEESPSLVINQRCIRDHRISLEVARRHIKKVPEEKVVRQGDVLVNSTGVGTLGRVAPVRAAMDDTTVDSHVTIVRPSNEVDSEYFAELVLSLESQFESMGVGSTGQTELSRTRVGESEIILAPAELQSAFSDLVRPMSHLSTELLQQNQVLTQARDLLLPRLISGELDVSDLELDLDSVA